jgi:hypothetical protein
LARQLSSTRIIERAQEALAKLRPDIH